MKKRMAFVFALFCMSGLVGCANDHTPLSDGTGTSLVKREITISYANWTDESEIYFGALNSDKMTIRSVQYLPIYRFDTKAEMEQFKNTFSETSVLIVVIMKFRPSMKKLPGLFSFLAKAAVELFTGFMV